MADAEIVFAFDARIDCPPCPVDMPSDRRQRFASASLAALENVFTAAIDRDAAAVVLFGELLNPPRTSPAQAADVAGWIESFCDDGRVVVATAATPAAAEALDTVLGDPPGLRLLVPGQPVHISVGPITVELLCDDPRDIQIATHRQSVACDAEDGVEDGNNHHDASAPVAKALIRGQRDRPRPRLSGNDDSNRHWTLPSLQPRSFFEQGPGQAAALRCSAEGGIDRWSVFSTAAVSWPLVRTVCSAAEQEDELSATAAAEVEQAVANCTTPLAIVRVVVDCEGDAERRGRVSRMAQAVLAEMRQLLEAPQADPRKVLAWCERVEADPAESLEHLAATDELGGSRRFPAMLVSEAASWSLDSAGDERIAPEAVVREAAWMALELLEDD